MSELTWSDDYSVHIRPIDNEHKVLVALVNDFASALRVQGPVQHQIVMSALKTLSRHIRQHFESEERFLLANSYPGTSDHQREHFLLLEQLDGFEACFQAEKPEFNEKIMLFLKDWLVRHIILHDSRFGEYFRGKNVITNFEPDACTQRK